MRLTIFNSFSPELAQLWRAVELSSPTYLFQSYEWIKFWHQTIGDKVLNIKPFIAVVLDVDSTPKMIVPFGLRDHFGARVLEFLGGQHSDYLGPLIHDDFLKNKVSLKSAWEIVLSSVPRHDVRHFYKIPEEFQNVKNPLLQILSVSHQDEAYYLSLPKSFKEFQKNLSSKIRTDNNRQRRRLSEIKSLSFEVFDVLVSGEPALDVMIDQKRRRYRNTGVPDILDSIIVQKFYREMPKIFLSGRIHFSILMLGDEILATHWGAVYRNRFYFLMPTITDGDRRVFSPGKLLLESLIEWSIKEGLEVFDFTIGSEEYKKNWCDGRMIIFEHLKITTAFGIPYGFFVLIKKNLKKNQKAWTLVRKIYSLLNYGR